MRCHSFPAIDEISRQLRVNASPPLTSFYGNPCSRYITVRKDSQLVFPFLFFCIMLILSFQMTDCRIYLFFSAALCTVLTARC